VCVCVCVVLLVITRGKHLVIALDRSHERGILLHCVLGVL
jgi:hypothetical protein